MDYQQVLTKHGYVVTDLKYPTTYTKIGKIQQRPKEHSIILNPPEICLYSVIPDPNYDYTYDRFHYDTGNINPTPEQLDTLITVLTAE